MSSKSSFPWLEWRPGRLAQHGGALLGWMLLRAAFQAATVILLARTLTAQTYGAFVAVVAVAGFATPLAGMGLANMVLRNVARDPQAAPWYLERARSMWAWTLLPLAGTTIGIALLLIPEGLPIVAMGAAVIGELLATSLTELAGRYRQAQHRHHAYGAINAGLPLSRLLALGLLVLLAGKIDIASVLWAYAAASLAYLGLLWPVVRPAKPAPTTLPAEAMSVTSGLPFSASALAMRLQGEFNKPVLAHAGFGLAGTYNIAQRAVEFASLPLLAMLEALWPRLYAQTDPIPQLRRAGLVLMIAAVGLGNGLWLAAPLLTLVVGSDYSNAVETMRWLALLPAMQVARNLITCHSIHRGWMRNIAMTSIFGGIISVIAVSMLVPALGLQGAVLATYATELGMSAALVVLAFRSKASRAP